MYRFKIVVGVMREAAQRGIQTIGGPAGFEVVGMIPPKVAVSELHDNP
jgi:hypothetical protein